MNRILALLMLVSVTAFGANPGFQDFNANQFGVNGNKVRLLSGVLLTNPVVRSGSLFGRITTGTVTNELGSRVVYFSDLGTAVVTNNYFTNIYVEIAYISNAFITNLFAENTVITNLYVTNLYAGDTYTTNLFVENNAYISNAFITNLIAGNTFVTNAYITNLFSSNSFITNLNTLVNITSNLFSTNIYTTNLYTSNLFTTNLFATNAYITNLTSNFIITSNIYTTNLYVTNIYGGNVNGDGSGMTNIQCTNVVIITKPAFSTNYTVRRVDQLLCMSGTNQIITLPNGTNNATAGNIYCFVLEGTAYASAIITNANGVQTVLTATALSQTITNGQTLTLLWTGTSWR